MKMEQVRKRKKNQEKDKIVVSYTVFHARLKTHLITKSLLSEFFLYLCLSKGQT